MMNDMGLPLDLTLNLLRVMRVADIDRRGSQGSAAPDLDVTEKSVANYRKMGSSVCEAFRKQCETGPLSPTARIHAAAKQVGGIRYSSVPELLRCPTKKATEYVGGGVRDGFLRIESRAGIEFICATPKEFVYQEPTTVAEREGRASRAGTVIRKNNGGKYPAWKAVASLSPEGIQVVREYVNTRNAEMILKTSFLVRERETQVDRGRADLTSNMGVLVTVGPAHAHLGALATARAHVEMFPVSDDAYIRPIWGGFDEEAIRAFQQTDFPAVTSFLEDLLRDAERQYREGPRLPFEVTVLMGVVEPNQPPKPDDEETDDAVRFLARLLRLSISSVPVEKALALLFILHGILGWTGRPSAVDVSSPMSWEEVPELAGAYDGSPAVLAAAYDGIAPRLAAAYDGIRSPQPEHSTRPGPRGATSLREAGGGREVVAGAGGAYDGVTAALAVGPDSVEFRYPIPVSVLAGAYDGVVPTRRLTTDGAYRVLAGAYDGMFPVSLSVPAGLASA